MTGGTANTRGGAMRFSGAAHAVDAATIEAWVKRAAKDDQLIYCAAPELIRGEGSGRVGELVAAGVVRSHQARRAGGGWEFIIVRTGYALRGTTAAPRRPRPLEPEDQAILSALRRAVNFTWPCPSDAELARSAGLATRDQAQWRVRKLIQRGLIASEQVTEDGVTTRIVTIVGPDGAARTTLPPPKHRAALAASRATVDVEANSVGGLGC